MTDHHLTDAGRKWVHDTLCQVLPDEISSHPLRMRDTKAAIIREMLHDYLQGRIPALEIKRGTELPTFIPVPWEYFTEGEP